jgi:hypothetical protein
MTSAIDDVYAIKIDINNASIPSFGSGIRHSFHDVKKRLNNNSKTDVTG